MAFDQRPVDVVSESKLLQVLENIIFDFVGGEVGYVTMAREKTVDKIFLSISDKLLATIEIPTRVLKGLL